MATYRAAYIGDTVLTGPEHSDLSDEALINEAVAEADRGDLISQDGDVPAAMCGNRLSEAALRAAIRIGDWTE